MIEFEFCITVRRSYCLADKGFQRGDHDIALEPFDRVAVGFSDSIWGTGDAPGKYVDQIKPKNSITISNTTRWRSPTCIMLLVLRHLCTEIEAST